MIVLSGRGSVGRNVKYRAEGMQSRQSYKVQGSLVTKLLSSEHWHDPRVSFLREENSVKVSPVLDQAHLMSVFGIIVSIKALTPGLPEDDCGPGVQAVVFERQGFHPQARGAGL